MCLSSYPWPCRMCHRLASGPEPAARPAVPGFRPAAPVCRRSRLISLARHPRHHPYPAGRSLLRQQLQGHLRTQVISGAGGGAADS